MRKNIIGKIISGVAVAATVMASVPGITAMAAEAPSGYTTDAVGTMAYIIGTGDTYLNMTYPNVQTDVMGYVNGEWRQVTYSQDGFYALVYGASNIDVAVYPIISDGGKSVVLSYVLTNSGATSANFVFSVAADTEVNDNDSSINTPLYDHKMLQMTYGGVAFYALSEDSGFCIVPTAYSGVNVSLSSVVESGADPRTVTEVMEECDSAFVSYWPSVTLGAGESVNYAFKCILAEEGADVTDWLGSIGGGGSDNEPFCVGVGSQGVETWKAILDFLPEATEEDCADESGSLLVIDMTDVNYQYIPESVVKSIDDSSVGGLHMYLGGGVALTFKAGSDYSNYSTVSVNSTVTETDTYRVIDFKEYGEFGAPIVYHTVLPEPGMKVTVYHKVNGEEIKIAQCVSDDAGRICFEISNTADLIIRYE